jgi:G:T/U-mismatch repair DNA glycosylase
VILDVGNCRARHLFAHVERAVWKALGYQLFGWVGRQNVPSETEEEDDAATGLVKKEEAATVPKAFLGGRQQWTPGPVAEPVPKKLRGSAGTVPAVAATSPRTRLTRCPAAREQAFTYPVEDAATGPGDEDW